LGFGYWGLGPIPNPHPHRSFKKTFFHLLLSKIYLYNALILK
jgi:hypothetical protein